MHLDFFCDTEKSTWPLKSNTASVTSNPQISVGHVQVQTGSISFCPHATLGGPISWRNWPTLILPKPREAWDLSVAISEVRGEDEKSWRILHKALSESSVVVPASKPSTLWNPDTRTARVSPHWEIEWCRDILSQNSKRVFLGTWLSRRGLSSTSSEAPQTKTGSFQVLLRSRTSYSADYLDNLKPLGFLAVCFWVPYLASLHRWSSRFKEMM